MAMGAAVKFIRKAGRIIPIKVKEAGRKNIFAKAKQAKRVRGKLIDRNLKKMRKIRTNPMGAINNPISILDSDSTRKAVKIVNKTFTREARVGLGLSIGAGAGLGALEGARRRGKFSKKKKKKGRK